MICDVVIALFVHLYVRYSVNMPLHYTLNFKKKKKKLVFCLIEIVSASPEKKQERWSLQFQTDAIFADNFVIFAGNFP